MPEIKYEVRIFPNSVRFYLPRTEGYSDIIREIAAEYGSKSLIEFDGYFEGKFEPVKYTRAEVQTMDVDEPEIVEYANKVHLKLQQKSLALEFDNKLTLVMDKKVIS